MPFDVQAAKQEGYSDEEISQELSKETKFDVGGAIKEGYSLDEIGQEIKRGKVSSLPSGLSEAEREKQYGVIRKTPPKWVGAVETGLETLGLVGGGTLGSGAGPLGTVGGAGLGYAAGREAGRLITETLGFRKPTSLPERFSKVGKEIPTGAAIQATGDIAGIMGSKVLTPFKQALTAPWGAKLSMPESQELIKIYQQFDIPFTPSDVVPSSKTLSIIEGVLGYRPVSGDVMLNRAIQKMEALNNARIKLINKGAPSDTVEMVGNRIKTEAKNMLSKYSGAKADKLSAMVDDLTQKMGVLKPEQAGAKFTDVMSSAREVRRQTTEDLYEQTKGMLPKKGEDVILASDEVMDLAGKLMKEEVSKPPAMQDKELLGILRYFGGKPKTKTPIPEYIAPKALERDPMLRQLVEESEKAAKPELTWTGMKETRSDLLERIRDIHRTQGQATKKSRIYDKLAQAIDRNMATFAEGQGGDLWKTFGKARESSRAMHELFDKDILKIIKSDPEDILRRVVNQGEISLLNQVRQAGGEEALVPLRQGFLKKILDASTTQGSLNTKKLDTMINKIGRDTVQQLMRPDQVEMIDKLIKTGDFFSEKMANMKTVEFLQTISEGDPTRIVNVIVKPNNSYLVKVAKKLLSPERIRELQTSALEDKVFKMSGFGNYLPVSSSKTWMQYEIPMKELLPPQTYSAVKDFLRTGQNMAKVEALAKNASQTGQVLLGSQVGSEVLRRPFRAWKTLGIPYLMARIYVHPKAVNYMTRALKVDPVSAEGISLFTKAVTIAGLNIKEQSEEEISTLPPVQSPLPLGIRY